MKKKKKKKRLVTGQAGSSDSGDNCHVRLDLDLASTFFLIYTKQTKITISCETEGLFSKLMFASCVWH